MTLIKRYAVLACSVTLATSTAMASSTPTTIGCSQKSRPAYLTMAVHAVTSPTCPLLEKKELRKLVDKFGAGTVFAHPAIPGTCLSGTVDSASLQFLDNNSEIEINPSLSYTESAQRLFPVPNGQEIPGLNGVSLFATASDQSLQAGAAMTAVHLEGEDTSIDLLVDDHFLIQPTTGEDTENFLILGAKGDYKVSGRLTGRGQIISVAPLSIAFNITGPVCL